MGFICSESCDKVIRLCTNPVQDFSTRHCFLARGPCNNSGVGGGGTVHYMALYCSGLAGLYRGRAVMSIFLVCLHLISMLLDAW